MDDNAFIEKCKMLGCLGEEYAYSKLRKQYPENNYMIIRNMHELAEMDFAVIDKKTDKVIKVFEVKTTTTDKFEFNAGSSLQLQVFLLQNTKKNNGKDYIPFMLWVVRAAKGFFSAGEFSVLKLEEYPMERVRAELNGLRWVVLPEEAN